MDHMRLGPIEGQTDADRGMLNIETYFIMQKKTPAHMLHNTAG